MFSTLSYQAPVVDYLTIDTPTSSSVCSEARTPIIYVKYEIAQPPIKLPATVACNIKSFLGLLWFTQVRQSLTT